MLNRLPGSDGHDVIVCEDRLNIIDLLQLSDGFGCFLFGPSAIDLCQADIGMDRGRFYKPIMSLDS